MYPYLNFDKHAGISRSVISDPLIAITFGPDASLCCHKGRIDRVNGENLF
jgi:hypothetical protein